MQAKCGSKKTRAINLAKFCYFLIFARFEVVTYNIVAYNNVFFGGHLRPTIHSRDLKQARTATAVNKQLNFTVKNKPHTTNYIYCIFYD